MNSSSLGLSEDILVSRIEAVSKKFVSNVGIPLNVVVICVLQTDYFGKMHEWQRLARGKKTEKRRRKD